MTRIVASCPFCTNGVVSFDECLEIVFNPDSTIRTPCEHLSFFWVSLSGPGNWNWDCWWERGQGLSPMKTNDLVTGLIVDLTFQGLTRDDLPEAACVVIGGTAHEREDKVPGAGAFWLCSPAGSPMAVGFDGYAVYAYDADAFVAAVHAKARAIRMRAPMERL